MSLEEEIAKAIRSHEQWKADLSTSIERGSVIADAADVGKDNICAFGRWLYGSTIPKDARYDPNYIIVRFIHSNFHQCAERVVQLLSEGRTAEATALIASNGEYTRISDQLMAAMEKWKLSVHKTRAEKLLHRIQTT
jgi:hypothetical protein